jgi:hypothetical protein
MNCYSTERYVLLKDISAMLDDANVPYKEDDDGELDFILDDVNVLTRYMDEDDLYDVVRAVHYALFN